MFGLSTAGAIALATMTAATAGASIYSANKQSRATKQAAQLQKEASDSALSQQTEEMRRANQNDVDTESLLESNTGQDTQSTMLTGPNGLTLDDLILGRGTSLLGGRQ